MVFCVLEEEKIKEEEEEHLVGFALIYFDVHTKGRVQKCSLYVLVGLYHYQN